METRIYTASQKKETDRPFKDFTIAALAKEVRNAYKAMYKEVPIGAQPYLEAMRWIYSFKDTYGSDSASSIVCYFLANAQNMKGETMRAVKAELNYQLEQHRKFNNR